MAGHNQFTSSTNYVLVIPYIACPVSFTGVPLQSLVQLFEVSGMVSPGSERLDCGIPDYLGSWTL